MLVKSLGAVVFKTPIFVFETNAPNTVIGEEILMADGTFLSYAAEIHTPYINLISRAESSEVIDEAQKEALIAMNNEIGAVFTLVYEDDSNIEVAFARSSNKISFTPLFTGSCSYRVNVPLFKT